MYARKMLQATAPVMAKLAEGERPSPLEAVGTSIAFGGNVEIYGEGEPADYLYRVMSGAVRTYKILNDGRRQVGGFYLPGDYFGVEPDLVHTFSAETICVSKCLSIKRGAFMALIENDSRAFSEYVALTRREIQRVQDHALLLVKSARERVASFLMEMAQRNPGARELKLPMPRQDIADYLGLTIETVSRTFTSLENESAITLPNSRRIVVRDRRALRKLNS